MKKTNTRTLIFIFTILGLPYGIVGGFISTTLPDLFKDIGIDLEKIGWYMMLLLLPNFLLMFYAPVIDIGAKRKSWIFLLSALVAMMLFIGCIISLKTHLVLGLILFFICMLTVGLIPCCVSSLMLDLLPTESFGKASAGMNIGVFCGFGLAPMITIPLYKKIGVMGVASIVGISLMLPSLTLFFIQEQTRPFRPIFTVWKVALKEIWNLLKTPAGWSGVLIFISPVCTFALSNLFTAFRKDYHVTENQIALVHGVLSTGLTIFGCMLAGYLNDRLHRRTLYVSIGVVTGLFCIVMSYRSLTPLNYMILVCGYNFLAGMSFSVFAAVALELIGKKHQSPATQYAVLSGAINLAMSYSSKLDTVYNSAYGTRSVLWIDGILNLGGAILLISVIIILSKSGLLKASDRLKTTSL